MTNRAGNQFLIYVVVSVCLLAYVASISGAFGHFGKPLDDRGAIDTAPPIDWQLLTSRLAKTGAALSAWIIVDAILVGLLRNVTPFIHYLVRVLVGWGMFLALGALIAGGGHRLLAAAIVFGVTAAFLGLWLAALSFRERDLRQHQGDASSPRNT
jgi:hypothetical protein